MAMSFDDAARALLNAPAHADIDSEFFGAQDVQIGDYTWDRDPGCVVLRASWFDEKKGHGFLSKPFEDMPTLFEALREAEERATSAKAVDAAK